MSAISDLGLLLKSMAPKLVDGSYVFCTVAGPITEFLVFDPVATFQEKEGLTLILDESKAIEAGLSYDGRFRQITLTVHSSLEAVGLTAAVSSKLAACGISANVVAAYYHDHVYVQEEKALEAMEALHELSQQT